MPKLRRKPPIEASHKKSHSCLLPSYDSWLFLQLPLCDRWSGEASKGHLPGFKPGPSWLQLPRTFFQQAKLHLNRTRNMGPKMANFFRNIIKTDMLCLSKVASAAVRSVQDRSRCSFSTSSQRSQAPQQQPRRWPGNGERSKRDLINNRLTVTAKMWNNSQFQTGGSPLIQGGNPSFLRIRCQSDVTHGKRRVEKARHLWEPNAWLPEEKSRR